RVPVRRSRRTTTGFPRPHPPPPLRGAQGRIDDSGGEVLVRGLKRLRAPDLPTTRWLEFGRDRRSIPRQSFDARLCGPSAAWRAGETVSLRKPVVVRSDRRPADRHSGGRRDGPIGFPKAHPSLSLGERAVRVRTETLPIAGGCGRAWGAW